MLKPGDRVVLVRACRVEVFWPVGTLGVLGKMSVYESHSRWEYVFIPKVGGSAHRFLGLLQGDRAGRPVKPGDTVVLVREVEIHGYATWAAGTLGVLVERHESTHQSSHWEYVFVPKVGDDDDQFLVSSDEIAPVDNQ